MNLMWRGVHLSGSKDRVRKVPGRVVWQGEPDYIEGIKCINIWRLMRFMFHTLGEGIE